MKIQIFLIFIILASCASKSRQARDRNILLESDPKKASSLNELNTYPEIFLANDSVLEGFDKSEGIAIDAYSTAKDKTRISLAANFSFNLEDLLRIQAYDFTYSSRLSNSYRQYWWNFQFRSVAAKFSAIAEDNVNNIQAGRSGSNQNFTIVGLGIGHRFRAFTGSLSNHRFFETINVFGNYVAHSDSSSEDKYQGYGYNADYGISYRASRSLTYGLKFSYNWVATTRSAENDNETLAQRSLVFGWGMFGVELGYYF